MTGTGPGQKLRIRFEKAGVKAIVLRFANLELGCGAGRAGAMGGARVERPRQARKGRMT